jgi:nucleotide-binding universal stress UspA family protein
MEIKNILFATDFSAASKKAAPYAADLAKRYGATLYILHVIQDIEKITEWYAPKVSLSELHKVMEEKSRQELQNCCKDGLDGYEKVEYRLIKGMPSEEILKFQQQNHIGLIVIGAHSKKLSGRAEIFGITTDTLVKHSLCPVLTVTITDEEIEKIKESTDPKICSDGEIRL